MPLTNSLYVPGKLCDSEHVIVDIGTGYYVKKARPSIVVFATRALLTGTHSCIDSCTGDEALRSKGGIHRIERWDVARDPAEETGQSQHACQPDTVEAASGDVKVALPTSSLRLRKPRTRLHATFASMLPLLAVISDPSEWHACASRWHDGQGEVCREVGRA